MIWLVIALCLVVIALGAVTLQLYGKITKIESKLKSTFLIKRVGQSTFLVDETGIELKEIIKIETE